MKQEVDTARIHPDQPGESRATLKEAVMQGIHRLAVQFQAAGDSSREAHLRAWRVLRRAFPFTRLDELQTNQFKQAIVFLEEQAGLSPSLADKGESPA